MSFSIENSMIDTVLDDMLILLDQGEEHQLAYFSKELQLIKLKIESFLLNYEEVLN